MTNSASCYPGTTAPRRPMVIRRSRGARLALVSFFAAGLAAQALAEEPSPPPMFTQGQLSVWKTALRSSDPDQKFRAIWALGFAREASAVTDLASMFDEERWEFWEAAAWALGNIKGKTALATFTLRVKESKYGRYIAPALAAQGDPAAVPPLMAMLKSSEKDNRGAAALALGQLRDARALDQLLALMGDDKTFTAATHSDIQWDPDKAKVVAKTVYRGIAVRSAALDALVQINDRRALTTLKDRLSKETDTNFQEALATAVAKLESAPLGDAAQKPANGRRKARRK